MDWAKAKTILITVFLIINLFLCYQVFSARIGNISYVDREKIGEVISYLQSKDVLVEGEIPYRKLDVPALTVQYKLFDQDELKQIFFPQGEAVASTYGASIVKLSGTSTDVSLRNGTELDFKNASIEPETGEIDEKKTQSLIDAWLRNLGIRPKDKFEKSKLKEAGFLVFKYEQLYKGLAIYNSHMLFNTNASGIREASSGSIR